MPSIYEVRELENKCYWEAGTYNGVNGHYVEGPNGNSIFIPMTGFKNGSELCAWGGNRCYWAGNDYSEVAAYCFLCDKGVVNGTLLFEDICSKYLGFNVRPVRN